MGLGTSTGVGAGAGAGAAERGGGREVEVQGLRVVELFTACAAAPDDVGVAAEADAALRRLDALLEGAGSA